MRPRARLLACLLLCGCGRSSGSLEHVEYMRSVGDFRAALVEVRNVLQSDPANARARFDFADLLYRTGDLNAADAELVRVKGSQVEVPILAARIAMARGNNNGALKLLEQASASQQGIATELALAKADVLTTLGRYAEARSLVEHAAVQSDVRGQLATARILELQGDDSGAQSVLAAATSQHPTSGVGWSMVGALALHRGDLESAEKAYTRAARADSKVDTEADRLAALTGLIETRLARGNVATARDALAALQVLAPNALVTGYSRAHVEVAAGNLTAAIGQLEVLLQRDSGNVSAWLLLSRLQAAQGDLEKAEASLRRAVDAAPDDLTARQQLAQMQLRLAHPEAALESLTAILAKDKSAEPSHKGPDGHWSDAQLSAHAALLFRHLTAGRKSDAARELSGWTSEEYLRAVQRLAALLAVSAPDAERVAVSTLRDLAADSAGNAGLQLLAAEIVGQSGDSESALVEARLAVKARPGDINVLLTAGDVMLTVGAAREALEVLHQIGSAGAAAADVSLAESRAELAVGNIAGARAALEQALAARPRSMQGLVLAVLIDLRQGQTDAALQRVRLLQSQFPGSAVPHVLLGDVLAARRDFSAAADAYARAAATSRLWQPVIREYQMRRAARQPDPAEPLRHWLTQHPADYPVRAALATYLAGTGRSAAAITELERMRQQRPDDAVALNDLAWLYGESGDPRALPLARQALRLQPQNPAILDTLGWLLIRQGPVTEGLKLVTRASQSDPNDLNIQFHKGYALIKSGERAQGEATLRRLLASPAEFAQRAEAERLLESTEQRPAKQ